MVAVVLIILIMIYANYRYKNTRNQLNSNLYDYSKTKESFDNNTSGKYYKYFEKNTGSTTEDVQFALKKSENLTRIKYLYANGLQSISDKIERLEHLIEISNNKDTKASYICELQPLYEKKAIAKKYQNYDFYDMEWLLRRVYNNGQFLTNDDTGELYKDMHDKCLKRDDKYQKKEKLYDILFWSIGIGVPVFAMLLMVLPWPFILLSGGDIPDWLSTLAIDYPFVWLIYISWSAPLVCWVIFPKVLDVILFSDGKTSDMNKKVKANEQVAFAGFVANTVGLFSVFKDLIKGPSFKD